MAIVSISRIQHRRGLKSDLPPALSEGELGWCLDTRELFIGNSDAFGYNTQILTQWSPNDQIIKHRFSPANTVITTSANRPIGSKLNDIVSIKDFGSVGTGVTDDTDTINAAIAELFHAELDLALVDIPKHVILYFPPGVYNISGSILLYPYVSLVGAGIDRTIIRCTNSTQTCMIETADSVGETGSNIGLSGYGPKQILVSNLTLDTNNNPVNIADMNRYSYCKFDRVKFKGQYQLGDGFGTLYGVSLNSIGNVGLGEYMDFTDCIFANLQHGIYSDDPVKYTSITRCIFTNCWSGITFGLSANFGGPDIATANQCKFVDIDISGIWVTSTNPGLVSTACTFKSCNLMFGTNPVYWGLGTTLNGSIGDVFDATAVADNGSNNIIVNAQQNNISNQNTVRVTMASPDFMSSADGVVIVKLNVPGPSTVNLPAVPQIGRLYTIKDGTGDASINNITIVPGTGTIDGDPSISIAADYAAVTVIFDGTDWNVI